MHSIRRRLMLLLAVGFAALLGGAGVCLDRVLVGRLTEEFDAALRSRANALIAVTEQEGTQIELDYDGWPEFERAERPDYFEFWLDDGTVLERSTHLKGDLPRVATPPRDPAIRDVDLPDGRRGRALEVAFTLRGPADKRDEAEDAPVARARAYTVVLVVARGREDLDRLIATVRWTLLGSGGALAFLSALLAWWALRTGLRPLDRIAARVKWLDARSLDARIPAGAPRELAPVVDQLNALLARLEESFGRERRFAANVAHELKTPIAELRSLADVASSWPDDAASVARFFGDVREISAHMERLVADLLLLARCEAGAEAAQRRPVRVRELVEAIWSRLAATASKQGLCFRLDVPEGATVRSEPKKLSIVLANLLDNAVSHALPGGDVRCHLEERGPVGERRFRLEISNPAPTLSPQDLSRLAEPFWKKDEARSPDGHAGLGLSLVSALAKVLDLDITFGQEPDGTFWARVEGPAEPSLMVLEALPKEV